MIPLFNSRRVSQERVMGISFVDILIQAVFVLLIALMAGYIDPLERIKIEQYEQVGKDLCTKLNKDNPIACRDYVQGKQVNFEDPISRPKIEAYAVLGRELCDKLNKENPATCTEFLVGKQINATRGDDKGSQLPCLKAISQNSIPISTIWEIQSPNEIAFIKFTPQYLEYIREDKDRFAYVQRIQAQSQLRLKPSEVNSLFGFIRQQKCFHEVLINWKGGYSQEDLQEARRSIWKLRAFE